MKLNLNGNQFIFHYGKFELLNESQINSQNDSIVVISSNAEHKHEQIRVVPFNSANEDKASLSFVEKLKYFKRDIRNPRGNSVDHKSENLAVVVKNLENFFTGADGLEDEYADFLSGFNGKTYTGYENNISSFFGDNFVDLSEEVINDLADGLAQ